MYIVLEVSCGGSVNMCAYFQLFVPNYLYRLGTLQLFCPVRVNSLHYLLFKLKLNYKFIKQMVEPYDIYRSIYMKIVESQLF